MAAAESQPKILAFSGSTRSGSWNQSLVNVAAKGAELAGADVTVIRLSEYPLPLFSEEIEKDGGPENLAELKALFFQSDGLLISSPEYNSSLTAVLKNTIDWVSRPAEGEPVMAAFAGKVTGIMATSPGGLGGLRGLVHLRSILSNLQSLVVPDQIAVPKAYEAFDSSGNLVDEKLRQSVMDIGKRVTEIAMKIR